MRKPALDVRSQSPAERLDLIEELWESLGPAEVPITEAQRAELASRVAAIESGEMKMYPLEQVLTAIRAARATGHS